MSSRLVIRLALFVSAALIWLPSSSLGDDSNNIPDLEIIPKTIPEPYYGSFEEERAKIEAEGNEWKAKIETHNATCLQEMEKGSNEDLACLASIEALNEEGTKYVAAVKAFNAKVPPACPSLMVNDMEATIEQGASQAICQCDAAKGYYFDDDIMGCALNRRNPECVAAAGICFKEDIARQNCPNKRAADRASNCRAECLVAWDNVECAAAAGGVVVGAGVALSAPPAAVGLAVAGANISAVQAIASCGSAGEAMSACLASCPEQLTEVGCIDEVLLKNKSRIEACPLASEQLSMAERVRIDGIRNQGQWSLCELELSRD